MAYVVAVVWKAKPGEEERVADILPRLADAARAEEGCIEFTPHRSPTEPGTFFLYEKYVDEAAFKAHTEMEHFKQNVLGEAVPRLASRERKIYETIE